MQYCLFIIQAINRYLLQIPLISQWHKPSPPNTKFYTQLTVHTPRRVVAGGDKRHLADKIRILHFPSLYHFLRLSSVAFGNYVGLLILWPRNSVHCRDDPSPDYRQITGMIYIPDFQFTFWTLGKRILTLWEPRVACRMQIMHSSVLPAAKCLT